MLQRGWLGEPVLGTIEMRAIPHWMPWSEKLPSLSTFVMSIHHLDTFRYWFGTPDRVLASTRPDPRTKFPHRDGINLYILEYDRGCRATSWDDVWTGPAREGSESDIYIRWRVEGTDGLRAAPSAGRATPRRRRARWTSRRSGSPATGCSRAGRTCGFPMRSSAQWPSCCVRWRTAPNRRSADGTTWKRSRCARRSTPRPRSTESRRCVSSRPRRGQLRAVHTRIAHAVGRRAQLDQQGPALSQQGGQGGQGGQLFHTSRFGALAPCGWHGATTSGGGCHSKDAKNANFFIRRDAAPLLHRPAVCGPRDCEPRWQQIPVRQMFSRNGLNSHGSPGRDTVHPDNRPLASRAARRSASVRLWSRSSEVRRCLSHFGAIFGPRWPGSQPEHARSFGVFVRCIL